MSRRRILFSGERWSLFRSHKRGWYSFWLLMAIFVVSLCADVVANDKPLILVLGDEVYFPFLERVSERELGGFFETEADYHDSYVRDLVEDGGGWMVMAPVPYGVRTRSGGERGPSLQSPSTYHWLGTDSQGRDVLVRLIHGTRISLLFGLVFTLGSGVIGICVGVWQGYYGGYGDLLGQRLIEIWSGIPLFFLLIILSSLTVPSFWWLVGIMTVFGWTALVGLVRAESLRTRNLPYVRAAQALGVGDMRVIFRHVLPNAMVSSLTMLPFLPAGSIAMLASLDFLGFGLPVGTASLGELLKQGKENPQAPWLGIVGFVSMTVLFCLMIFIGEAVRDVYDPRRRSR